MLSLQSVGGAVISPDGKHIAFTVRTTEWKENRYDTEIWLSRDGGKPVQITRTPKGSSTTPRWSPDGKWIGFLADRGSKQQVYLIAAMGGEAVQLTRAKDGVNNFRWSPDGKSIAFTSNEPESQAMKDRKEKYGEFSVEDGDYVQTQLWITRGRRRPKRRTVTRWWRPSSPTTPRSTSAASPGRPMDRGSPSITPPIRSSPPVAPADISIVTVATKAGDPAGPRTRAATRVRSGRPMASRCSIPRAPATPPRTSTRTTRSSCIPASGRRHPAPRRRASTSRSSASRGPRPGASSPRSTRRGGTSTGSIPLERRGHQGRRVPARHLRARSHAGWPHRRDHGADREHAHRGLPGPASRRWRRARARRRSPT